MSNRANDDYFQLIALLAVVIGGIAVWKFSQVFGLPWQISIKVLGWMLLASLIAGVWTYFSRMSFEPKVIWPLYVAALYLSWFPAFDYWGVTTTNYTTLSYLDSTKEYTEVAWYALWYVKLLITISLVAGGYILDNKVKEL
ncbi:hypothetical protein [Vibrio sp. H11]|uniref:hypothetical protein n=1 Tax=Vibrio sp. H11 TaxID=2565928 RepID=UPI0010A60D7B|nr:hypothetical protein [Vibrio sp. H11]